MPNSKKKENTNRLFLYRINLVLNNFYLILAFGKFTILCDNRKFIFLLYLSESNNISKAEKEKIFNESFMPHADALYNFAYKLVFDEDEAKDLLQETFLKAFRFFDYYEQGTNAKAWLFRILKNTFINEFRKKSKAPNKVDYSEVEEYYNNSGVTVDLRNETVKQSMGDEIVIAVNSLPVDFRTAIILCDVEGFTYEEMSGILDIPVGTVRSRLHRARHMLKEKLIDYATKKGYSV